MQKMIVWLIMFSLLISGCGVNSGVATATKTAATQAQTQLTASSTGYPAPNQNETAYPAISDTSRDPTALPKNLEPSSNQVGTVRGRIVYDLKKSGGTYPFLFLAEVKTDEKGNPMVASLDKITAPRATYDSKGNFAFINIKPGRYVLMVDLVLTLMIMNDDNGKEKLLQIEGGKIMDVGTISVP